MLEELDVFHLVALFEGDNVANTGAGGRDGLACEFYFLRDGVAEEHVGKIVDESCGGVAAPKFDGPELDDDSSEPVVDVVDLVRKSHLLDELTHVVEQWFWSDPEKGLKHIVSVGNVALGDVHVVDVMFSKSSIFILHGEAGVVGEVDEVKARVQEDELLEVML